MVLKYSHHIRSTTPQKRHVKALSFEEKKYFITGSLEIIEGRCIGYAPTQHRGCLNPIKHHQWKDAFQEIIDTAEDETLQSGEGLEEIIVDLAQRMSCYLHKTQQNSLTALLKAIKLYRRTFAMDDPRSNVRPRQPYESFESPQNNSYYDDYAEPTAFTANIKYENVTDAFEEALESKFHELETRIDDKISRFPRAAGKQPTYKQGTDALDAMLQILVEKLHTFGLRIEERLNDVQEKHEKDMQTLAASINPAHSATPKKAKSAPAVPGNTTGLLDQFALFLQQQSLLARASE